MEVFVPYKMKIGTRLKNQVQEESTIIFNEKFIDKYLTKNVGEKVNVSAHNLQLMNYMDPNCKYENGIDCIDRQSIGTITFVGKLGVTIETTEKIAEAIKKDQMQIAILNYYNTVDPNSIIKVEISLYWHDADKDKTFIL